MLNLSLIYQNGEEGFVVPDPKKALYYLELSAKRGNPQALNYFNNYSLKVLYSLSLSARNSLKILNF